MIYIYISARACISPDVALTVASVSVEAAKNAPWNTRIAIAVVL